MKEKTTPPATPADSIGFIPDLNPSLFANEPEAPLLDSNLGSSSDSDDEENASLNANNADFITPPKYFFSPPRIRRVPLTELLDIPELSTETPAETPPTEQIGRLMLSQFIDFGDTRRVLDFSDAPDSPAAQNNRRRTRDEEPPRKRFR